MPQVVTAAEYVAMIVVVVPCLFIMALLPLLVDARQVRRSRQHAPAGAGQPSLR